MESIWEHSTLFRVACEERTMRVAPEMDCARQLTDILRPRFRPGMTVLDAGSAAGHYYHSLKPLGAEYYGIDSSPMAVSIGRKNMPQHGLPASRLRHLAIDQLPETERYDVVFCFNTLMYCANYHQPIEILCRATRSSFILRDIFADRTTYRWEADVLLDDPWKDLHAYFNIWGRDELRSYIERQGFTVEIVEDRRRREKFGGTPEVVGGISLPYEIMICERKSP